MFDNKNLNLMKMVLLSAFSVFIFLFNCSTDINEPISLNNIEDNITQEITQPLPNYGRTTKYIQNQNSFWKTASIPDDYLPQRVHFEIGNNSQDTLFLAHDSTGEVLVLVQRVHDKYDIVNKRYIWSYPDAAWDSYTIDPFMLKGIKLPIPWDKEEQNQKMEYYCYLRIKAIDEDIIIDTTISVIRKDASTFTFFDSLLYLCSDGRIVNQHIRDFLEAIELRNKPDKEIAYQIILDSMSQWSSLELSHSIYYGIFDTRLNDEEYLYLVSFLKELENHWTDFEDWFLQYPNDFPRSVDDIKWLASKLSKIDSMANIPNKQLLHYNNLYTELSDVCDQWLCGSSGSFMYPDNAHKYVDSMIINFPGEEMTMNAHYEKLVFDIYIMCDECGCQAENRNPLYFDFITQYDNSLLKDSVIIDLAENYSCDIYFYPKGVEITEEAIRLIDSLSVDVIDTNNLARLNEIRMEYVNMQ